MREYNPITNTFIKVSGGGTGTSNYNDLENKPSINDVPLIGNKTLTQLGINLNDYYTKDETYTKLEVDNLIPSTEDFATKEELNTKQDTLESGTNIKTINNESLLGSGNIDIQGGDGANINVEYIGDEISVGEIAQGNKKIRLTTKGTDGVHLAIVDGNNVDGRILADSEYFDTHTARFAKALVNSSSVGSLYGDDANLRLSLNVSRNNLPTIEIRDTAHSVVETQKILATQDYVDTELSDKQDTLVSGTNIKSINGQSLLGSGNLSITGSEYIIDLSNPPSLAEITEAYQSDKVFYAKYDNNGEVAIYPVNGLHTYGQDETGNVNFCCLLSDHSTLDVAINYEDGGREVEAYPTNLVTSSELNSKQDKLVSGTNIKTINNESLLGSGNITIQGDSNVFLITKDTTSYEEILSAFNDSKGLLFRNTAVVDGTSYPVVYALKQTDHILLYVHNHPQIIDVWKVNIDNTYEKTREFVLAENQAIKDYVNTQVATKQDTLVSGTNIKSINNQTLLGDGNININPNTWGNWKVGQDTTGWNYKYRLDTTNMMLECFMEKNINIACTETSGNFYRSNVIYIEHLKEFSDNLGLGQLHIFDVNINVIKSGYPIFTSINSINSTGDWDLSFYLVSGNTRNATSYKVMVHFVSSIDAY